MRFLVLALISAVLAGCGGGGGDVATNNATSLSGNKEVMLAFDEINGTTAYDSNSGYFNAAIYGANRVAGKVNNALHFGTVGARAEISVGRGITFPNSSMSVDAWIKLDSVAANGVSQIVGDNYYGLKSFRFQIANGRLQMLLYDNNDWGTLITGTQILLPNSWYHVAFTYDGTTAKTYINGTVDNSANITTRILTVCNTLYVGSLNNDVNASSRYQNQFYGTIDELRISNSYLSPADIYARYLATVNSSAIPTPVGTAVSMATINGVFLGTATGASFVFPSLVGSDIQGHAWSGSLQCIADGVMNFEGQNVTKSRSLVSLQLAGGTSATGGSSQYFFVADGSYYKVVENSGTVYVPSSQTPFPNTARVGDSGTSGTFSGSDGSTVSMTWALNAGFNGDTYLVISAVTRKGLTVTATETDTYQLASTGVPKAVSISVTTAETTVTMSGPMGS